MVFQLGIRYTQDNVLRSVAVALDLYKKVKYTLKK